MFVLNNLNILELEDYIKSIFNLKAETSKKDKEIAVMEFELQLASLAKHFETETLQCSTII